MGFYETYGFFYGVVIDDKQYETLIKSEEYKKLRAEKPEDDEDNVKYVMCKFQSDDTLKYAVLLTSMYLDGFNPSLSQLHDNYNKTFAPMDCLTERGKTPLGCLNKNEADEVQKFRQRTQELKGGNPTAEKLCKLINVPPTYFIFRSFSCTLVDQSVSFSCLTLVK